MKLGFINHMVAQLQGYMKVTNVRVCTMIGMMIPWIHSPFKSGKELVTDPPWRMTHYIPLIVTPTT